jgi:hypothetical protein
MKVVFSILITMLFAITIQAQPTSSTIRGKVVDASGDAIPFASVYKSGTSLGTSANSEGDFQLALGQGKHSLHISAVGYKPATVSVTWPDTSTLRVVLEQEAYALQEVVIGNAEDPAYAMIKKAIRKRPEYLRESGPFTARVYIKGLQRMLKAPKKFLGVDIDQVGREMGLDSNRTGIIYLSESESNITVDPPKEFREEMISSKVSGSNRAFSFNRASDLQLNFYENHQAVIEGLSSRPFVSPIAQNALSYYRYHYLGTTEENGRGVVKIRVTPRRKAEPLYRGDIYLVEDEWRIHSVNLLLDKDAGINFVDSLHIKQLFVPVEDKLWMPSTVQLDFRIGMMGFEVGGFFTAIYQDYQLSPAFDRRAFKEVLRIEEGVNRKDSAYWMSHRPIPLTAEESRDYLEKDSIRRRNESKAYLDSVDRKNNTFKPLRFLTGGYMYRNRYRREYLRFGSPLTSVLYNTVEGVALNYDLGYSRQIDTLTNRYFSVNANLRYGFANKRFNGSVSTQIPLRGHRFNIAGGSAVLDLNDRGSLPVLFNSISTLFAGENRQKLYEMTFASAGWSHTLPGNINLSAYVQWSDRRWLPNATDFTFSDKNRDKLTSNNPFRPEADVPLFEDHTATKISVAASYSFSNRYATYPSGRRYLESPYPTVSLRYTKGLKGVLGSDVDYDFISAGIYKSGISLGMWGNISVAANAGTFLNNKKLYYTDYQHFNGNEILLVDQKLTSFLNLDYYRWSTNTRFLEAHTEYNMGGVLTSKVPLLRKLKLEEIVGLHYLNTPEVGHYGEMHLGLQWKMLRVMYSRSVSSHSSLDGRAEVRIGLKIF